ncbi:MAG: hypothetical protein COT84_06845 [Chlamydiae bacterium CG10_big_fil_rev_8_21_14_0_10_35_9]|nr:MAG: hypothetical protein COT84_06845 [Chlamydiae bacterium CG10_big_fil_rev_8_21_14_0_10_35_9]
MAAAASNSIQSNQIDLEALECLKSGDETRLQNLAARVSETFLNSEFHNMCLCNYASAVANVVNNNPNFPSINITEILEAVGHLCFHKQQGLIELVVSNLSKDDIVTTRECVIDQLELWDFCKPGEYSKTLLWARQSLVGDLEIDEQALKYLKTKDEERLQKVAPKVSAAFLNREFSNICLKGNIPTIEGIIKNNPNYSLMFFKKVVEGLRILCHRKQKDLINLIISGLQTKYVLIARNHVLKELEGSGQGDMLRWAQDEVRRIARNASIDFLEKEFCWMCSNNFAFCVTEIVDENKNFALMSWDKVLEALYFLARDQRKELIECIEIKLSSNSEIINPSERLNEGHKVLEPVIDYLRCLHKEDPEKYDEMLKWACDRNKLIYKIKETLCGAHIPPNTLEKKKLPDPNRPPLPPKNPLPPDQWPLPLPPNKWPPPLDD